MPSPIPTFNFRVYLDFDADGITATDEITDYVKSVDGVMGIGDPLECVAAVGECNIIVHNGDRRWSTAYTGSPYYGKLVPFRAMRVDVTDGYSTYTVFTGVLKSVRPTTGQLSGMREATITCMDAMGVLQAYDISIPLQQNKTADYLLKLIASAAYRSAYASGTITFSGQAANNDTATVNGTVYVFKTTLSGGGTTPNEVLIGATVEATIDNLYSALSGLLGSGTTYGTGTTQPSSCAATPLMDYYRTVQVDNPVRYYRLGEAAGTNAADVGTNNRAATYVNSPALGADGALRRTYTGFDGVNDYVSLPVLSTLTNASFSLEVWARPTVATAAGDLFSAWAADSLHQTFVLRQYGRDLAADFYADALYVSNVLTIGGWNHLVVTYDVGTDTCALYVNGVQVGQSNTGPYSGSPSVVTVASHRGTWNFYAGDLAELAIYPAVLSAARVLAHYQAHEGNYDDAIFSDTPARYYPLAELGGTSAADFAGGATGTYTNGPTLGNWEAGDPDPSAFFDGVNDYVSAPVLDLTNRSYSIEFWWKCWQPANDMALFEIGQAAPTTGNLLTVKVWPLRTIGFELWYAGGALYAPNGAFSWGVWNHFVCTFDSVSGQASVYVNGTLRNTATLNALMPTIDHFYLGHGSATVPYYQGNLDEVQVYFSALASTQVAAHYAARRTKRGLTISANARGTWGNNLTLAKNGANITVSGATLSGGVDGPAGLFSYESGLRTFDVAGDRWDGESTNALSAANEITQSEGGRLWVSRSGSILFKNGDYLFRTITLPPKLTFDSDQNDADPSLDSDALINQIRLTYRVRSTLTTGVIAKAKGVIAVPGKWGKDRTNPADDLPNGGSTTVEIPYVDNATGQLAGAVSLKLPLTPGVDYTVNEAPDGSGVDYTYNANIFLTAAINGSKVELTARNTALGTLHIIGLQIQGTALVAYNPQSYPLDDTASINAYGRHSQAVDVPLPVTNGTNYIQSRAYYLLNRFKNPAQRVNTVNFGAQTVVNGVNLWGIEIGDVLVMSDYQTAITSQRYLVTGMQWSLGAGKNADRQLMLNVLRLDENTYWILGDTTYGALGGTTRIAI